MSSVQWVVLVVGAVTVLWLSRRSLWRPGRHGFYRSFALLAILALVVINVPRWFVERYSVQQAAATLLLYLSLALIVVGLWQLWRQGRPGADRGDESLLLFETTRCLVTTGLYRWIRHPMYASLLLLALGSMLKQVSPVTLGLAGVATVFLVRAALADEHECREWFGEAYQAYQRHSWRFIPGLW